VFKRPKPLNRPQNYGEAFTLSRKNAIFAPALSTDWVSIGWGLVVRQSTKNRQFQLNKVMGVTELKRKGRRNRAIANNKTNAIKQLLRKPIIKNVDVDAIKASFAEKKAA
jgi:hypothetical protein